MAAARRPGDGLGVRGEPPTARELRAMMEWACSVDGGVAVMLMDHTQPWPYRGPEGTDRDQRSREGFPNEEGLPARPSFSSLPLAI